MRLGKVEPVETMMVAGFAYRTFERTRCGEVERRMTFTRHSEPSAEPAPVASSPPVAPDSADTVEPVPPMGAWARAVAKLHGR